MKWKTINSFTMFSATHTVKLALGGWMNITQVLSNRQLKPGQGCNIQYLEL